MILISGKLETFRSPLMNLRRNYECYQGGREYQSYRVYFLNFPAHSLLYLRYLMCQSQIKIMRECLVIINLS